MADLCGDFWMRETGTGQQQTQLHDRYMMMMMMIKFFWQHCLLTRDATSSDKYTKALKKNPLNL
jgi:hypothetical protein